MNITAYELKQYILDANPRTHFFEAKTMKFFGDTMRNFGVCSAGDAWELYRRKPVKHGLNSSFYFDKTTYKQVYGVS